MRGREGGGVKDEGKWTREEEGRIELKWGDTKKQSTNHQW